MLYFDEAGYTGADLNNKNQPFFTLASTCLTEDEMQAIRKDIGYDEWGRELHFVSMYTNYRGRGVLNKIFSHPLLDSIHVKLAFALKRYCIYAQMVDILVETYYYMNGINIYVGAKNLLLSNGLYYLAISHSNQQFASALSFVLTPRTDKYQKYQVELKKLPIFKIVEVNVAPASIEYLEKRMQDVNGIDPLDYICDNVRYN